MNEPIAVAPAAPGALGQDVAPELLMRYLDALGAWRDQRRRELDELDAAALSSPEGASATGDITLSMALWKAVSDRHDLLLATWNSGRVGPTERRQLTTLIWGRLEQQPGANSSLAVSLPEASRLSDSLASSLRARLSIDGADPDHANRLRALRAQVERIRDQLGVIPEQMRATAAGRLDGLDRRLDDVVDRSRRGADIGGLIGTLEADAALTERDLIVGAAQGAQTAGQRVQVEQLREELIAKGKAVQALADKAAATVRQAPRLAVPDVTALGPVPTDPGQLTAYADRLGLVERALGQAHTAYAAALEHQGDLATRQSEMTTAGEALSAQAAADLAPLRAAVEQAQQASPVDLQRVEALVAAQHAYLSVMRRSGAASPGGES
ncbi:MAG: hypothetical protein LWW86_14375 [Micrococcales bacterium]|nr:hypothetical protein [Micrococcales bacterium]